MLWKVENKQYHVMMGTHDQTGDETQTDDEVVVRSQVEAQTHQAVGSVADDPMSTEHGSGSRVASGSGDLTRPKEALVRTSDTDGTRQWSLDKRPRSVNPYESRCNSRASTLPELSSAEVEHQEEILDVQTPPLVQRQDKFHGVSSRGAWEGRLRPRGRGTSQYRAERRRRYSTSSSPDLERETNQQSSPLAVPLQNGRFNGEACHRTTSEFGSQSRDSSVERPRDRELQDVLVQHQGQCLCLRPEMVSRWSQVTQMMRVVIEIFREVHSILSSRGNVRQGVRSKAVRADVMVHGDPDEPVDLHGDIHPGNRQKRVKSCARVQSVNTVCHDEQRLIPRPQETSPKRRRHVCEVHAPMRTQPNSELPHSRIEPMITNNKQCVPER